MRTLVAFCAGEMSPCKAGEALTPKLAKGEA
jgi:hypothetical protein